MRLDAVIAAAYVEVQSRFGFKPDVRRRVNALLRRPVEADFRALVHYRHEHSRVILDVGANRGETIAAIRLYQPAAPIVAFEPNPVLARSLARRFGHDPAVRIENTGLGRAAGTFDLYVPYYKGVPFDGLASFREQEAADWLNGDRLAGFDPSHQVIEKFSCQVRPLDALRLAPGLIKIDVQGLEADVIAGARATLEAWLPPILMENNQPERDAAELLALGYAPHAWRDGRLVAGHYGRLNTFYVHPRGPAAFDPAIFA